VAEATLALRRALIDLAGAHRETVYPAHTHTQPAQPSTVAHYLLAAIEQLERDTARLVAAYRSTNVNPLGACAITGTGFPIDRDRTSELLGFDAPTGNTYGSIATVDYLIESTSAAATLVVGLGRLVQDLLLWCTAEVGYLRLGDPFVQVSSIMPQKRNPVALEQAFAELSAVPTTVHNTPFGDIVDTEDDLQPLVATAFRDATRAVALVAAAMTSAEFDVARMRARATEGWVTVTELADTLTREHGVPFKAGHAIASRLARRGAPASAEDLAVRLAAASREVAGREIRIAPDALARVLSPEHFIAVRKTWGGPAPEVTGAAVVASRRRLADDEVEITRRRQALAAADVRRRQAVDAL